MLRARLKCSEYLSHILQLNVPVKTINNSCVLKHVAQNIMELFINRSDKNLNFAASEECSFSRCFKAARLRFLSDQGFTLLECKIWVYGHIQLQDPDIIPSIF
jgi:hypothetical protein